MWRMTGAFVLGLSIWANAASAAATCDELWFTRNAVLDRAGQCFSSALGRAVFDNAGCTGDAQVGNDDRQVVQRILTREADLGCNVDTRGTTLDIPDLDLRLRMADLPVVDDGESACLTYRGRRILLHEGIGTRARIRGSIESGDRVMSQHRPLRDRSGDVWTYYTAAPADQGVQSAGWTRTDVLAYCDDLAG